MIQLFMEKVSIFTNMGGGGRIVLLINNQDLKIQLILFYIHRTHLV